MRERKGVMTQPSTDFEAWIRRYHQAPSSGVRLVCFPHAGGSASFFFPVSARLSPAVDVAAVQYPGRQDRRAEANIGTIPEMADAVLPAVRALADRPLAFFGHSMGAVLAYEVARRLERDGAEPLARLYVSGRRAPSRHRSEHVHELDDAGLVAELQRLSGTDSSLLGDPEARDMILPAVRSDYHAVETYRHVPGAALRCPVVALVGDRDPQVTRDEALAWAEHSSGPFDLRVFPGGHFYLVEHGPRVIQALADDLAAVRVPSGAGGVAGGAGRTDAAAT
ncbi:MULTISPECIES: thioesterase II family protein [Actinomadura]|uniref:Thioesterase II family protein n=1 Tax=Actinomadura yumaensis TaxID=111807 RepID=A0ABW2CJG5_9ACTN|nr:alpha/beta fold hydrolase [Actinomadura sp. J1-007]